MSHMQFIMWVLLLVTGSYLLIGKVPEEEAFRIYRKSRRIAGGAFLVYCIQFFLQWRFDLRDHFPEIAAAVNISFFYLGVILLGFSFISRLSEKPLTRSNFVRPLIVLGVVCAIVWISILFLPHEFAVWGLRLGIVFRLGYAVIILIKLIKLYKKAIIKIQNYHSDNVAIFIIWMSKILFYSSGIGLSATILLAIAPHSKRTIIALLIMGTLLFYYIFMNLIDYLIHFTPVKDAIEEDPDFFSSEQSAEMSAETMALEGKILQWIADKGYTRPKINLDELAKELDSNRTYLSSFINSNYECSYYEWIAGLRIEEAKKMLQRNPAFTITQISESVGFSSNSHFTSLFTKEEGIPPSQWRKVRIGV